VAGPSSVSEVRAPRLALSGSRGRCGCRLRYQMNVRPFGTPAAEAGSGCMEELRGARATCEPAQGHPFTLWVSLGRGVSPGHTADSGWRPIDPLPSHAVARVRHLGHSASFGALHSDYTTAGNSYQGRLLTRGLKTQAGAYRCSSQRLWTKAGNAEGYSQRQGGPSCRIQACVDNRGSPRVAGGSATVWNSSPAREVLVYGTRARNAARAMRWRRTPPRKKGARSAMTNAFEVRVVRRVTQALVECAWFGQLLARRCPVRPGCCLQLLARGCSPP
jgi:hypothetical protein